MSCRLDAAKVKNQLQTELKACSLRNSEIYCGILRIGNKADDIAYENSLLKQFPQYGITPILKSVAPEASIEEVKTVLTDWNRDPKIKGILPLLPLPERFAEALQIAPQKDIDGVCNYDYFFPCTPQAVMKYLKAYGIPLSGRKAVVLGRSPRVGKPLAALLTEAGAEVTVVHSKTKNPAAVIRRNDLVFSAVGKPRFLTENLLCKGQTVIDIGINPHPDDPQKICGDLDEDCIEELDLIYTPVPGGIGSITTLVLIAHLLQTEPSKGLL